MSWLRWYDASLDEIVQSEVDPEAVSGPELAGVLRGDISKEPMPGIRRVPRLRSERAEPIAEALP